MRPPSIIIAAAFLLMAQPALAQATRTFVSGHGSDANPCSLAAPCRSFQQAHNAVAAGGEIVALDAAGYGTLTISKAITVTAVGIEASITSSAATPTGIIVNGGAGDVVTIRGLTLFSGAGSGDGIDIQAAKSVTIRDCAISGFPGDGIFISPSASLNVELRGVSVNNNGGDGLGIVPAGSGAVAVSVTDSSFSGNDNGDGVFVGGASSTGTIKATLNVVAVANHRGISLSTTTGQAQPVVMVTGSTLVNNSSVGLLGNGNMQVFVDRTQISGNGVGWEAGNGAAVSSYKNNAVNGNGLDGLNGVVQITSE